jgi:cobalt-precorrin 5A hydrolase
VSDSLGIWLVRSNSEALALALQKQLGGKIYRSWLDTVTTQKEQFASAYRLHNQWIMIAACGIAVRFVDGLTQDKLTDPAIVLVDEAGRFAISLLSGHEGGANLLAYRVANTIGSVPVITTATEALKPLVVGIGCRKGVTAEQIGLAVHQALASRHLSEVREITTIDLKANEPGLLEFCRQHNLPLRILTTAMVQARPWLNQSSDWVQQNIGLPGVCEPCALIANSRGTLIVAKTTLNGVAVAIVEDKYWMEK